MTQNTYPVSPLIPACPKPEALKAPSLGPSESGDIHVARISQSARQTPAPSCFRGTIIVRPSALDCGCAQSAQAPIRTVCPLPLFPLITCHLPITTFFRKYLITSLSSAAQSRKRTCHSLPFSPIAHRPSPIFFRKYLIFSLFSAIQSRIGATLSASVIGDWHLNSPSERHLRGHQSEAALGTQSAILRNPKLTLCGLCALCVIPISIYEKTTFPTHLRFPHRSRTRTTRLRRPARDLRRCPHPHLLGYRLSAISYFFSSTLNPQFFD